jgi:hypothetical protein
MRERVSCDHCGAHRDRALPFTERCFGCGRSQCTPVPPNAADLREFERRRQQQADNLRIALDAGQ